MYLEQMQLSQATGTHNDILFFRTPRALLSKVLNNQSPTRHSFSKPANYQKGPGKLQMQIPGLPSRTHGIKSLGGSLRNADSSKSHR